MATNFEKSEPVNQKFVDSMMKYEIRNRMLILLYNMKP